MSHNNDRDPTDAPRLGALASAVLALAQPAPAHQDPTVWSEAQERVAGLFFAELLSQGVLTPAEHEGCFLEDPEGDDAVSVRVPGLGWLSVGRDGSVDFFEDA